MIKLTTTANASPYANLLVFGEAGAGKTTLCKTAENPLIISAEGGLLALQDEDLPVFLIKDREDCNEVYEWLTKSNEADEFDTICIDSLSEIAEVLLADEKANSKDARQAYGVMNDEMTTLIRAFRDLPKHVYFSAKMKRLVDDASGRVSFIPSVPGQTLLQGLPYFFDEVLALRIGVMEGGATYRYLMTKKDTQWEVKDRSNKLEPMDKPDLKHIIAKVVGTPQTQETQTENTQTEEDTNGSTAEQS